MLDPAVVLRRMAAGGAARRLGGGPGAHHLGRPDRRAAPCPCPTPATPTSGALLPALVRDAGLELVDAWAEAPAGVGPGPVTDYLSSLTEVDPGDDPVVLPPLVTVIGRACRATPRG